MLNRSLMIVTPAVPYIAWAESLQTPEEAGPVEPWTTAYLIPEFDTDEDPEATLGQIFPVIFARFLSDWTTDEAEWPKRRTLDMFKSWFTFAMHTTVEDVCADELEDDEDDEGE